MRDASSFWLCGGKRPVFTGREQEVSAAFHGHVLEDAVVVSLADGGVFRQVGAVHRFTGVDKVADLPLE